MQVQGILPLSSVLPASLDMQDRWRRIPKEHLQQCESECPRYPKSGSEGRCLLKTIVLKKLASDVQSHFETVDLIACPTLPISPPALAEVSAVEGYAPRNVASLRNTVVGNVLGLCGITLPVGLDASGMPVGLQLLGKHGSDAKLLSMACRIEKILGTSRQRLGIAPCFK